MDTEWLWKCFAQTGNIEFYMAWKQQQVQNGDNNGNHQSTGDRDRDRVHGR